MTAPDWTQVDCACGWSARVHDEFVAEPLRVEVLHAMMMDHVRLIHAQTAPPGG